MWNIKFLNQTNYDLQAKLLKLFERVKIYGANLGEPHTKSRQKPQAVSLEVYFNRFT